MSDTAVPPQDESAETGDSPSEPTLDAWAERYLDLFQRNWTAWLESTPAMLRAALASAGKPEDDGQDR